MATLTLTGNADQLRRAFEDTVAGFTQTGRSQTVVLNDTPGTGAVVRITGTDGIVRDY